MDESENVGPQEIQETATLAEWHEDLLRQEEDVNAILGGDDGQQCTYAEGYLPRQAVFACLTCRPEGEAGFCLSCSLHCHEGHSVVEIYTRRHFRCDCGNSKFSSPCQKFPEKDTLNTDNVYNQNYVGLYCTCHRPYPDPERDGDEEMVQCCICEDWFHEEHLGLKDEVSLEDFEEGYELVCATCAKDRCDFLAHYPTLALAPVPSPELRETKAEAPTPNPAPEALPWAAPPTPSNGESHQVAAVTSTNSSSRTDLQAPDSCPLSNLVVKKLEGESLFMQKGWRDGLHRCAQCLEVYKEKGVEFLFGKGDTVAEYEERARQRQASQPTLEERAQTAFQTKLSHVQQVELLHGFNDFSSKFKDFLAPFAANGEIVTKDAVSDFFEQLQEKRRRLR